MSQTRRLSEAALDAVIAAHLDYVIGDRRVFEAVLGSCSEDDIQSWAKEHGYQLNRFHAGAHTTLPGQGGHAYRCICGWQGSEPCPRAPRFAPRSA